MRNSILDYTSSDFQGRTADVYLTFNNDLNYDKVVILIEGEDDRMFYSDYFKEENVSFFVMSGHEWMSTVLNELTPVFPGYLAAIKDADFSHLDNAYYPNENMFVTDCHDWEMTIASEQRTATVARRYGVASPLAEGLHARVMHELRHYSYVRWANSHRQPVSERVGFLADAENMKGKTLAEVIEVVNDHQEEGRHIELGYVEEFVAMHPNPDERQLHNGHDYMRMLRKLITENSDHHNIKANEIPTHYARLFTGADFSLTRLASSLRTYPFAKEVLR